MAAIFAAGGGDAVDDGEPMAWLWPCNVDAWRHWCAVQTQWRTGMGGATGLDYAGVRAYLLDYATSRAQRVEAMDGIQAAERAALDAWGKAREDRNRD